MVEAHPGLTSVNGERGEPIFIYLLPGLLGSVDRATPCQHSVGQNIESTYHSHNLHQNPLEHFLLTRSSSIVDQFFLTKSSALSVCTWNRTAAYYDISVDATLFRLVERDVEEAADR